MRKLAPASIAGALGLLLSAPLAAQQACATLVIEHDEVTVIRQGFAIQHRAIIYARPTV